MNAHAPLARRLLSAADNARVCPEEVDAALDRATRGLAPRCRLEVAAVRVYRGPNDTSVPPLEALPLRPTALAQAWGYLSDRKRTGVAAAGGSRSATHHPKLSLLPRLGHRGSTAAATTGLRVSHAA